MNGVPLASVVGVLKGIDCGELTPTGTGMPPGVCRRWALGTWCTVPGPMQSIACHMSLLALNVVWRVCDWLTQFTGGGYDVLPLDIVTVEARH